MTFRWSLASIINLKITYSSGTYGLNHIMAYLCWMSTWKTYCIYWNTSLCVGILSYIWEKAKSKGNSMTYNNNLSLTVHEIPHIQPCIYSLPHQCKRQLSDCLETNIKRKEFIRNIDFKIGTQWNTSEFCRR